MATFGGAAVAAVAANGTSGVIKDALQGAAAATACLGIVDLLRLVRPAFIYGNRPRPESPPRQAAPADAITRADFERAVAEIRRQHASELAERERAHEQQLRAVRNEAIPSAESYEGAEFAARSDSDLENGGGALISFAPTA